MATSSIFKIINAKDRISILKLVNALEESSTSKPNDVVMSVHVSDMSRTEIMKLFGEKENKVRA